MLSPRIVAFFLAIGVFAACQKTTFQGSNNNRGNSVPVVPPGNIYEDYKKDNPDKAQQYDNDPTKPKPGQGIDPTTGKMRPDGRPTVETVTLTHGCDGTSEVRAPVVRSSAYQVSVRVQGEICPDSRSQLHIMLVMDASGSMGRHRDDDTKQVNDAHDPVVEGSCSRLKAIKNVLDGHANNKALTDNIVVSLVPFAGAVIGSKVIETIDLQKFRASYMNQEYLCRFVAQDEFSNQLGAYRKSEIGNVDPGTNYQAAFQRAQQILSRKSTDYPNAEVWFVTDGAPTVPEPKSNAETVAASAGLALRNEPSLKNKSLYAAYFGVKGSNAYSRAEGILTSVTGSKERVIQSESAADLVNRVLSAPRATINLNAADYIKMAKFFVPSAPEYTAKYVYSDETPEVRAAEPGMRIGIQSIYEIGNGKWRYITQPTPVLVGQKGQTVENTVRIKITGADSFLFNKIYRIDYKQE